MQTERKGIIYHGIKEVLQGKKLFMMKILQYPEVAQALARRIEESELKDMLDVDIMPWKNKKRMHLALSESDLELIYDRLLGSDILKYMKKYEDEQLDAELELLMRDGETMEIDITYFLVYALMKKVQCRQKIQKELEEGNLSWEYASRTRYRNENFEGLFPPEQVWTTRVLLGFLEKMREEPEYGADYQLFMQIICAGYRKEKNQIKKARYFTGEELVEEGQKEINQGANPIQIIGNIIIWMVLMDEMEKPLMLDYRLLTIILFWERYQQEMVDGWAESALADEKQKSRNKEFLNRFQSQYGTCVDYTTLMTGEKTGPMEAQAARVLGMFHLNYRMLEEYRLSREEMNLLVSQSDEWSMKSYKTMLLAAQLSKCLSHTCALYLEHAQENKQIEDRQVSRENHILEKENRQYEQENKHLQNKNQELNKIVSQQELEIRRLSLQLEKQETKEREEERELQELQELRDYAEAQKKEKAGSEETKNQKDAEEIWKKRRVLVVGGHINWQIKLRERFPQWQFIASDKTNIDREVVQGKEYIVCNTEFITHACYNKILANKGKEQELIYVHSQNLNMFMQELEHYGRFSTR